MDNILATEIATYLEIAMNQDEEYAAIVANIDWQDPVKYVEPLRKLTRLNHRESMNTLAVVLGDVDSAEHRDEIIALYTEAHRLGSPVAAEGMSIQYAQWGDAKLSDHWKKLSKERSG